MRFSLKALFAAMTVACLGAAFPPTLLVVSLISIGLIVGWAIDAAAHDR